MKIKKGNDVRELKFSVSKVGEPINFQLVTNLEVVAVNSKHDYKKTPASKIIREAETLTIYFSAFTGPIGLYHLLVKFSIPDLINDNQTRIVVRGWENAFQIVDYYEDEDTSGAEFVDDLTFGLDGKSYYQIWLQYYEGSEEDMLNWHKGPKGDTGDAGPVGPQGLQGIQGEVGPAGPQGLKGDTGDAGPVGPQGLQGIQGEVGPAGPQGLKGDTGDVGPQGIQGPKGDTGDVGPAGPQGLQGIQGPQGETGPQGLKGLKGDTGDAFVINAQGALEDRDNYNNESSGFSFLDTINGNLYIKNSEGWSDPIPFGKGPKGDTGDVGPVGPQGLKGDTGDVGPAGPQGIQGETGLQGLKGDAGDVGPQGIQGPQGIKGDTGDAGPQGLQGIQGETGPQGLKGDTGDVGPAGPQGPQGETGPQGPAGSPDDAAAIMTKINSQSSITFSKSVYGPAFYQSSDKKLKENIESIPGSTYTRAHTVELKQFNFKGSKELKYGIIADELEITNPELVHIDKNGYKSVDYIGFLLLRIAKLENDIKEMKS